MDLIINILSIMGRVFMETFTSPLFVLIYLGIFIFIAWQYRQAEKLSLQQVGKAERQYLRSALSSIFLGLMGAAAGSVLLIMLGIDLSDIGILQLWVVAMGLMLINPRFLCFAYAGGIISLTSLFLGYPQINIPSLVGLIAVLHMVESLLIFIDGHLHASPIYIKRGNQVCSGYYLHKFWPIPFLAVVSNGLTGYGYGLEMPSWWPLLKAYPHMVQNYGYVLVPVLAVLGYAEIDTICTPVQKTRKSALRLFLYSALLLLLAFLASHWNWLIIIAAIFSPLGHEFTIWLGLRDENHRPPLQSTVPGEEPHNYLVLPGDHIFDLVRYFFRKVKRYWL